MPQSFVPFAGRSSPFVDVLPANIVTGGLLSGNGSPEGVMPGTPGQRYRDLLTDDLWIKIRGTQTVGWTQVGIIQGEEGGVASRCAQVFKGPINDPNGVIIASGPALYYSDQGSVWEKSTTTLDSQNWVQLIGPP